SCARHCPRGTRARRTSRRSPPRLAQYVGVEWSALWPETRTRGALRPLRRGGGHAQRTRLVLPLPAFLRSDCHPRPAVHLELLIRHELAVHGRVVDATVRIAKRDERFHRLRNSRHLSIALHMRSIFGM